MAEILRFACDHCGKQLSAKSQHAGRSTRCPACQKTVTVPMPEPVPSHSEDLNEDDILQLLGDTKSKPVAVAEAESETNDITMPVQSDVLSTTSTEFQAEKLPAIPGHFRRLAQLPRPIVLAGGILLVAAVSLTGWSFMKPARPIPTAVDDKDNKQQVIADNKPSVEHRDEPRIESIDLLKGDFDKTTAAYFKQKFPDSINVDATIKFCTSVDTQGPRVGRVLEATQDFNANANISLEAS